METYVAFSDLAKAVAFERYLKSGSGKEFSRRRFYPVYARFGGGIRRLEPRDATRRRPTLLTGVQRHRWPLIRILARPSSNRGKTGGEGMGLPQAKISVIC